MKKRRSPIARNLLKNSIAGMFSAIEVHNKPLIAYRYETVVLLVLNSWELALKAYIYKHHNKTVKLFHKDGTTKQFDNCLNITNDKIGKDFNPIYENLNVLYDYRNQVAHFYLEELNPILFSLISKSIIFYSNFIKIHFKIDLSEEANLILLPIGFKRPISPIDYISTNSINSKASTELKDFLKTIVNASRRLNEENIDETIFSDFKMNLTNVTRITNADLIAGIDNTKKNDLVVTTIKETKNVVLSKSDDIKLTRDKSISQGTLFYEELQDGIFDEINNIVDANKILAKNDSKFVLGQQIYYRIYSERQHVNFNIEIYELLARTALLDFNAPFLYWLNKLPAKNAVEILKQAYDLGKANKILILNRISILLGDTASKKLQAKFIEKFKNQAQKPNYVYTLNDLIKSKQTDPVLKSLKASPSKSFNSKSYLEYIENPKLSKSTLSNECLKIFNNENDQKAMLRELDFLAYGDQIVANSELIREFINRF